MCVLGLGGGEGVREGGSGVGLLHPSNICLWTGPGTKYSPQTDEPWPTCYLLAVNSLLCVFVGGGRGGGCVGW